MQHTAVTAGVGTRSTENTSIKGALLATMLSVTQIAQPMLCYAQDGAENTQTSATEAHSRNGRPCGHGVRGEGKGVAGQANW